MTDVILQIESSDLDEANKVMHALCGIVGFFACEEEKEELVDYYTSRPATASEDRAAYGDWQTPRDLALTVCREHLLRFGPPDMVVEPTCGLGAFVAAALEVFPHPKEIHAVEINPGYVKALKYEIFDKALLHAPDSCPDIFIHTADFFDFDFSHIFSHACEKSWNVAVIGNPPWVTNSHQGRHGSANVPVKSNTMKLRGIEAITGKSNFDISEFITLRLLEMAQHNHGGISFLLKNSVIRNIVMKQKTMPLRIGGIRQLGIDASKEFGVAVAASCLSAQFNIHPEGVCEYRDLQSGAVRGKYGWLGNAFAADLDAYRDCARYDGESPYEWRSGIKHDCAQVLEMEESDGLFLNGLGEEVKIEPDLIYPLLKSSDINKENKTFRKYIIVPQRQPGESTERLRHTHPMTYRYLHAHRPYFAKRKSTIYRGKDQFSIFGIGDYSFKPFKIVVSALYKDVSFRLVEPCEGKPVIVDDTCYQLGFDSREEAVCTLRVLQSPEIRSLLHSLVFPDAKRVVTKGLLMRLDVDSYCREHDLLRRLHHRTHTPTLFDCLSPE